jgi:hypothetical protein
VGHVAVIFRRGLGGRAMVDVDGLLVVAVRVVGFDRRGGLVVSVVVMAVIRGRRMVVVRGLYGRGRLIVSRRGGRMIVVSMIVMRGGRRMIVMAVRGCGMVVVTVSMVVVRLVLVAHDSIPQPLCAVFSGESGIT